MIQKDLNPDHHCGILCSKHSPQAIPEQVLKHQGTSEWNNCYLCGPFFRSGSGCIGGKGVVMTKKNTKAMKERVYLRDR